MILGAATQARSAHAVPGAGPLTHLEKCACAPDCHAVEGFSGQPSTGIAKQTCSRPSFFLGQFLYQVPYQCWSCSFWLSQTLDATRLKLSPSASTAQAFGLGLEWSLYSWPKLCLGRGKEVMDGAFVRVKICQNAAFVNKMMVHGESIIGNALLILVGNAPRQPSIPTVKQKTS